jgi:hydrogenase nickel incorporation protein HypB
VHSHGAHSHEHTHSHEVEPAAERLRRVERSIFEKNDRLAAFNRGFFAGRKIYAANLWSAPGSGKTSLIERLVEDVGKLLGVSVIEGDLATERDAERIRAKGARVVQVNTGAVCHLDAHMVGHALETLDPPSRSVVLIENVGNLVCPSMFDLGEHDRIALFSVTEGEDKPIKYPHIFAKSTAIVISKMDLLPHVPFDLDEATRLIREVNPRAPIFEVASRTGSGMEAFYVWLTQRALDVRGANDSPAKGSSA